MEAFWESLIESIRSDSGLDLRNSQARPVGGGCINEAYLLESGSGLGAFVKINTVERIPMFEAEAEALSAIAKTATIRVPIPFCVGKSGGRAFLALEAIPMSARSGASFQEKLGRQLADLHRAGSANGKFGWHRDNTIGELPQRNPWTESWTEFFGNYRLGYQLEIAAMKGHRPRLSDELLVRLPDLFGDHEPVPSLLHGDLWGGNAAFDNEGEPVIYDPATYYGDREADLAFTELFGGFGPAFYEGYNAAWRLDPGYPFRKQLYNLYHVLNHANHFGGGYAAQAESIIARLLDD